MAAGDSGRTQKRGRVTKERLLDATLEALFEKGYAETSLPELCRRAGLSRGAQLHHFPTKEALLVAAVERLMERRQAELRESLVHQGPDELAGAFVAHLWSIYSGPTFHAWLELAVAARTRPELRRHLVEVNERFYQDAYRTLREVFPLPEALLDELPGLARFVTSLMNGVAVNRILDDDDEMAEAALGWFRRALEGFLSELAAPALEGT